MKPTYRNVAIKLVSDTTDSGLVLADSAENVGEVMFVHDVPDELPWSCSANVGDRVIFDGEGAVAYKDLLIIDEDKILAVL